MHYIGFLFLAHMAMDFFLQILPPLLPFLMRELDLTIGLAGTLVAAKAVTSGLAQPFFGLLVDRGGRSWLLPVTVAWVGLFVAAIGLAQGYTQVMFFAVIAGLGGALFHPLGAVMVRAAVGNQRAGSAMAVFGLGGTIGMAIAPVVTVLVASRLGITGLTLFAIPALVMAGIAVVGRVHRIPLRPRTAGPAVETAPEKPTQPGVSGAAAGEPVAGEQAVDGRTASNHAVPDKSPAIGTSAIDSASGPRAGAAKHLFFLSAATMLRVLAQTGLATFLPLYYVLQGHSEAFGGTMLSLYMVAGAAAAMLGGYLADRYGRKVVTVVTMILATPMTLAFLGVDGWLSVPLLLLTSAVYFSTFSVTIVYAQELMPDRPALASGLIMGFVWGLANMGLAPLGVLADAIGLPVALRLIAFLPLAAALLMIAVPETKQWRASPGLAAAAPRR